MFDLAKTAQARGIAKWCACALLLLAPGSFVVLPVLWFARYWAGRRGAPSNALERGSAGVSSVQIPRTA